MWVCGGRCVLGRRRGLSRDQPERVALQGPDAHSARWGPQRRVHEGLRAAARGGGPRRAHTQADSCGGDSEAVLRGPPNHHHPGIDDESDASAEAVGNCHFARLLGPRGRVETKERKKRERVREV